MAVPTITNLVPSEGHSGGKLVEILGTNFRLQPDPSPSGTVVLVEFARAGSSEREPANSVGVCDEEQIIAITPILDPFRETTSVAPETIGNTFVAAGHRLKDGQVVQLTATTFPAGFDDQTPYFVVTATAGSFQLSATEGGTPIALTDVGAGVSVIADGAYDVIVTNLDNDLNPIAGETVTFEAAFRPLRPNLSGGSHLEEVVIAFLRELKRQVVKDVSFSVHTDYDEETGDLEVSFPARVPHLVLGNVEMNENRDLGQTSNRDENYNDPDTEGDFVTYRRSIFFDISGDLIGVTNNQFELFTLLQATRAFFVKNDCLRVRWSGGEIEYDLRSDQQVSIEPREDNTNLSIFRLGFTIRGVRLEQIPGLPEGAPTGVPTTGRPTEAIVEVGRTLQVDVESFDGIEVEFTDL